MVEYTPDMIAVIHEMLARRASFASTARRLGVSEECLRRYLRNQDIRWPSRKLDALGTREAIERMRLVEGKFWWEIARELNVSEETLRTFCNREKIRSRSLAYTKLNKPHKVVEHEHIQPSIDRSISID